MMIFDKEDDCSWDDHDSNFQRTSYHPWQRRKVAIPREQQVSSLSSSSSSAYSVSDQFWQDLIAPLPQSIPRRPWPSSQVLSSTITPNSATSMTSPLLQGFYESVGKSIPELDKDTKASATPKTLNTVMEQDVPIEDLDNPSFSTLTPSQHRRYWKLVQQTERRTPSERIHWKQLQALIPTEQDRYRKAVHQFWFHHKNDRLLLGLQSSSNLHGYCQWACTAHSRQNDIRVATIPATYGKCRQILSMRSSAVNEHVILDVTTLDFKPVAKHHVDQIPSVATLPINGSYIPYPCTSMVDVPLSQDTKALELANEHGAQMIVTDQTLESLLMIPSDRTTEWILPVTRNNNGIVMVDSPLAQMYNTPRDCLSCGIQEGLFQHVIQTNSRSQTDVSLPPSNSSCAHVYTIWNLPTGRRSKPLRVLIRSTARLVWHETTQPLKIRVHVEYFPERGQEIVSRHERSLWILDQLLGHVDKLCRVDGRNGTIIEWQDTSIAHAFAADTDDPMQGFAQLVQFLQAVSSIDFGDGTTTTTIPTTTNAAVTADSMGETSSSSSSSRLLCLPSRETTAPGCNTDSIPDPYSASVHAPTKHENDDDVVVDLQVLLRNADGVLLNTKAIGECYRPWRWDSVDRIPYTFPTIHYDVTNMEKSNSQKRRKRYPLPHCNV